MGKIPLEISCGEPEIVRKVGRKEESFNHGQVIKKKH